MGNPCCCGAQYPTWAPHRGPTLSAEKYGVRNRGGEVRFENWVLQNPCDEGTFKFVAFGRYTSGLRKGQSAVGKWPKILSHTFFQLPCCTTHDDDCDYGHSISKSLRNEVFISHLVLPIVAAFNAFMKQNAAFTNVLDKVSLTIPEVWSVKRARQSELLDTEMLIEPYLPSYTKFNSNSGWSDTSTQLSRAIQALSHFSYHYTDGCALLCDLQGGIHHSSVILTDPALLSPSREFGPSDLGWKSILSFFDGHHCTAFCSPHWLSPPP